MEHRPPPELEMNLQGEFVSPPRAPVANRILLWAIVVAAVASALSVAAFALWVAFMILPVALGAAAVAWLAYRYQVWRARRVMGGQRGIWRP